MRTVLLFMSLLLLTTCSKKSDDNYDYRQPLPEATQTGEVMFACYVNGQAYIAHGFRKVKSFYQRYRGANYFSVGGSFGDRVPLRSMVLGGSKITLEQGGVYELSSPIDGEFYGGANFPYGEGFAESARTNDEYTGTLTITHFDLEKEQVAGTFSFDLKNPLTGERVEIREGRFDTFFSR